MARSNEASNLSQVLDETHNDVRDILDIEEIACPFVVYTSGPTWMDTMIRSSLLNRTGSYSYNFELTSSHLQQNHCHIVHHT
jgi:hypothetical protein